MDFCTNPSVLQYNIFIKNSNKNNDNIITDFNNNKICNGYIQSGSIQ